MPAHILLATCSVTGRTRAFDRLVLEAPGASSPLEGTVMHRPLSRAVAILTLAVLLVSHTPAGAQETTPVPTVVGEITIAETRFGLADIVPTAPVSIVHYRIEMPPGTQLVVAPNPSLEMYRIASGMVTITLEDD